MSTVVSKLLSLEPGQVNSGASQLKKKCFFVRSLIIVILNIQETTILSFTDHFKDIINLINILKKGAILLSNNIFFISLFHFPQNKAFFQIVIDTVNIMWRTTKTNSLCCIFLLEDYGFPLALDFPPQKTTFFMETSYRNISLYIKLSYIRMDSCWGGAYGQDCQIWLCHGKFPTAESIWIALIKKRKHLPMSCLQFKKKKQ